MPWVWHGQPSCSPVTRAECMVLSVLPRTLLAPCSPWECISRCQIDKSRIRKERNPTDRIIIRNCFVTGHQRSKICGKVLHIYACTYVSMLMHFFGWTDRAGGKKSTHSCHEQIQWRELVWATISCFQLHQPDHQKISISLLCKSCWDQENRARKCSGWRRNWALSISGSVGVTGQTAEVQGWRKHSSASCAVQC